MAKILTVHATVNIPRVPNFLLDAHDGPKFPLSTFSDDSLREIGIEWTENLVQRAHEQRAEAQQEERDRA